MLGALSRAVLCYTPTAVVCGAAHRGIIPLAGGSASLPISARHIPPKLTCVNDRHGCCSCVCGPTKCSLGPHVPSSPSRLPLSGLQAATGGAPTCKCFKSICLRQLHWPKQVTRPSPESRGKASDKGRGYRQVDKRGRGCDRSAAGFKGES